MNTNYIYVLKDSSGSIFYIGKSKDIRKRKKRHIYDAKRGGKLYIHCKIRKLIRENIGIEVEALESGIPDKEIDTREQFWIADFRSRGIKLYNLANGGQGGKGMTPEMHKAAGKKRKGQKRSKKTREKMSQAKKGIKFTSQHKKALSKAWKRTPEQIKNQSKKASKTAKGNINIKIFKCISPDGQGHITNNGLKSFCEEHNLTPANMHHVLNGRRKHHKGWTIERINDEPNHNLPS